MSNFKERPDCSVCLQPIPVYSGGARNGPVFDGYVLPETEKDKKGNILRHTETSEPNHEGKVTVTAVDRLACAPCYLKAYAVAHPGVPLPALRRELSPEEVAEYQEV